MKASKLVQVIRTFSPAQQTAFDRYLQSPYFHRDHRGKETIALWEYIKSILEETSVIHWRKKTAYQHLYPNDKWIDGKVDKLMSKLFALVKQFLIQQERERASELDQLLLLNAHFARHRLDALFANTLKKMRHQLAQTDLQDAHYFYQQFQVEASLTNFKSLHNNRRDQLNLPATHTYLDTYYLLSKLSYACQLLSFHTFVVPLELESCLEMLDDLLPFIPQGYLDIPILQLYHAAYQLLRSYQSIEPDQYQHFYNCLQQSMGKLSENQLKPLRTLIRNYAISQYHRGNKDYVNKAFQLYREDLDGGYLYYNDCLLPGTLNNLVTLGLRQKALDWVEDFLKTHQHRICGVDRPEVIFQFNWAHYCFYRKEYEQALKYLSGTYEDQYYRISARRLEIMIHYAQQSDLLDPRMHAFKLYIYRMPKQLISAKQKEGNGHFIDLLKQICLPRTSQNPNRIQKLLQKAKGSPQLAERFWLIEVLEALL